MRVEVLGCDGGIGGPLRTCALRVDDDVLIDAGTGLGELPRSALIGIDHVFVTHAHLDHFAHLFAKFVALRERSGLSLDEIAEQIGASSESV